MSLLALIGLWSKWHYIHCFNPNFVLNSCVAVALQSIITLIANFSFIKILLGCFLVHLLAHGSLFYGLNGILLFFAIFSHLILFLYVSHSITIFQYYQLLFQRHFSDDFLLISIIFIYLHIHKRLIILNFFLNLIIFSYHIIC